MKTLTSLVFLAAAALAARAEDPAIAEAVKLEKAIAATTRKVVPSFVFLDGGSGVLISADGWFLTNHHVVADMQTGVVRPDLKVNIPDGRFFKAEVVGIDAQGDICLCRIKEAKDLPFSELADSDALKVGEAVIAVGNPFMLGSTDFHPTVSFGLISAIHTFQGNARPPFYNINSPFLPGYCDAIQTDAAVNPGNSGGPLFTLEGKVAGINGRINPRFGNRVNSGIGYAIPANQIKNFMRDLKKGGFVPHAKINGLFFAVDAKDGNGAVIGRVDEGSNAEESGFKKGDRIESVAGIRIHNTYRMLGVVGTYPAGATIAFSVKRGEEAVEISVKLDKIRLPAKLLEKADLDAKYEDGAETDPGVILSEVKKKSFAEAAGLKKGDRILKFNGLEVKNADSLRSMARKLLPNKIVPLVVKRGEVELDLEVVLGSRKK